jgi:hypothetical protein
MQQLPHRLAVTALAVSIVLAGCLSGATAIADELDQPTTPDTTTAATTPATTTATPTVAANGCHETTSQDAELITVTPTESNLSADHATALAEQYEQTYRNAQSDLDERGSVGTAILGTDVTRVAGGYLVELDVVFGGEFVITAQPGTTVVNVDDFYTVYYFVSPTMVVRHESSTNGEPPADPQDGGEVLVCRDEVL